MKAINVPMASSEINIINVPIASSEININYNQRSNRLIMSKQNNLLE